MSEVPDVPWNRATQKQRSMRSEEKGAKQEGGRTQPNSGALPGRKGDFIASGFLVDDKYTDKRSFTLKLDGAQGLLAICRHALMQGHLPSWRISLPGLKLRAFREEDALYLIANQKDADAH